MHDSFVNHTSTATSALSHVHGRESYFEPAECPSQEHEEPRSAQHQKVKRGLSNNITLRILTLGASIAYGYPSTSGNGFRNSVRNKLVWDGNPVNMVGTVKAGSM